MSIIYIIRHIITIIISKGRAVDSYYLRVIILLALYNYSRGGQLVVAGCIWPVLQITSYDFKVYHLCSIFYNIYI